ncbi:MAG: hypothetical protein KF893_17020 [Caldilineaceae bacterium]|nr:hypothetical protein [Caldilineaceae bacterium]
MPNYICQTCGTQFSQSAAPPDHCPICEDERQYSYPNLIPLPAATVERIAVAVAPYDFDRIYGAWWERNERRLHD